MKLGFLGGGQLARMMILEAQPLGLECHVFCGSKNDPAAQVCAHWHSGDFTDSSDLLSFVNKMDLVTFESEFVPVKALLEIEKKQTEKIFPRPSIMGKIQNRQSQKQLLIDYKIPTAPYVLVKTAGDLDKAWDKLQGSFVLKTCYGGYDGYGTHFGKKFSDLGKLAPLVANSDHGFIAEKWIPFKRELAVMLFRNKGGEHIAFPLVQSYQVQGTCDLVAGPMKHPQFDKIRKKLFTMMDQIDYVGALGIEFFDTGKELLVNELAPRVHNSGHYSQNALLDSQFCLHLKAGLGHRLMKPRQLSKAFVMANILGTSDQDLTLPTHIQGKIHLYGKRDNRPRRKMGHVNYIGDNIKKLISIAIKERKLFQP